MARTTPVPRYCRKPGRQPSGPHCHFGSRYVNTVMGIDSLLSKSIFLRKIAQRIDSAAERIDSLGLCCISAELLSSKPSNDESKSVPGRQAQCSHAISFAPLSIQAHHIIPVALNRRGRNKLRVAANGASIGALGQKLYRSEGTVRFTVWSGSGQILAKFQNKIDKSNLAGIVRTAPICFLGFRSNNLRVFRDLSNAKISRRKVSTAPYTFLQAFVVSFTSLYEMRGGFDFEGFTSAKLRIDSLTQRVDSFGEFYIMLGHMNRFLDAQNRFEGLPEEHWFDDDNERLAYDERLSKMEILPPRFIGDGVLPDEKYLEFWRLIDIQGLRLFLYMPNVWDLRNEGVTFKGGNNPHGTWNEFNKLDAIRGLRLEHPAPGKYAISRMSTDHRLLLYVLSYVLLPRKSNHGSASEEDLLILWAMPTSFLAHAHLWSRIFEIALLDLTREKDPQVETDAPAQIPTETGVPPQFQSDIAEFVRKGFEDMRSIMTEGFARLSDRIDRLDTHMTSQDTDLCNLRDEFHSFHGERMYVDFQEQPEDNPMQD
ncbi:hypothetical protein PIB30_057003 [Stylosanthes scabra]|uniref:Uncharacterized protein n=1 Tax=Stylosanthes scabra TaxID=79078 RepID=A0ABU6WMW8_9FABA|nr:hypothetical protein [Stylosanthes scabra]